MKIKPEDLAILKARVKPFDTEERRIVYRAGNFPFADRVKNLNMRYRWDTLYLSKFKIGDGAGVEGDVNLYAYMNDDHIDTALKSFIGDL